MTVSSGGSTVEVEVTVIRLPVAVIVTPQSLVLSSGESQQVTAAVVDNLGHDIDVLQPIAWSSSDEAVATVSPTGLVTSVGPEGSAILTATMDTLTVSLGAFVGTPPAGEKLATVPFDEFPRGVTVTSTGRFFIAGYGGFASGTLPTLGFSKQATLLGPGEDVVLNGSVTRAYLVGTTVELNGSHPTGVVVMDLATSSPIDFLPVGLGRPSSGALSGDGTVLTVGTDHGFERIDLATKRSLGGTAARADQQDHPSSLEAIAVCVRRGRRARARPEDGRDQALVERRRRVPRGDIRRLQALHRRFLRRPDQRHRSGDG